MVYAACRCLWFRVRGLLIFQVSGYCCAPATKVFSCPYTRVRGLGLRTGLSFGFRCRSTFRGASRVRVVVGLGRPAARLDPCSFSVEKRLTPKLDSLRASKQHVSR